MDDRVVHVGRNGCLDRRICETIRICDDWDEFRKLCLEKLGMRPCSPRSRLDTDTGTKIGNYICKIYNEYGGEIEDISEIIPNELLLVAEQGETYIEGNMPNNIPRDNEWVMLNVGGKQFATTRATLTKDSNSMLAKMFGSDWESTRDRNGAFLLDRSPEYFSIILHYLRCGQLVIPDGLNPEGVLQEAIFFNISSVIDTLTAISKRFREKDDVLSRRDLCSILVSSSSTSTLRGQGTDLENVDLSRLDLSHINLKMSNLEGANLKRANLDNAMLQEANLARANLQYASLRGANLGRANLEEANLKGALFEDRFFRFFLSLFRGGLKANLEGANLKEAVLDDSNFSGANLRAANLKGCSMENANMLRADLAGADLEGTNLKGANLNKANLMGANLRAANFDIRTTVSSRQ